MPHLTPPDDEKRSRGFDKFAELLLDHLDMRRVSEIVGLRVMEKISEVT